MSIMLFCSVFDRFWQLNYAARNEFGEFQVNDSDRCDRQALEVTSLDCAWKTKSTGSWRRSETEFLIPRTILWHVQHVFSWISVMCFYLYNIRFSNIFFLQHFATPSWRSWLLPNRQKRDILVKSFWNYTGSGFTSVLHQGIIFSKT